MVNLKADQEITELRIEPGVEKEEPTQWVYRIPCAGVTYFYFVQPRTKPVSRVVHPAKEAAASIAT
jgi:hypothetical protein